MPRNIGIFFAAALVIVSLSMANYVAWLRLKPEVSAVGWIADKPDFDSHVANIHKRAIARANGGPDSLLPIYDIQNPGFFLLVAELYARAGATTPLPLEITSIVLFDVATICFFFWVYLLFGDVLVAAFATSFLSLSQFFLFFPGTTHTFPFEFFFFNLTMLFYTPFLKSNKQAYFVAALIAMFITCMNYWFYYMSSWIIMIGLWWQYRGRPSVRIVAIISASPVIAASLTAIMVMALFGMENGLLRLADIFVARTVDARIPGGSWYPDQRFLFASDWHHYPVTVMGKLDWAYSFNFYWFAAAAGCALLLLWSHNRKTVISALILLAGGFSWYYVMFQHTHIHHFVGQYSFMAICPIFGLIMATTVWVACGAFRQTLAFSRGRKKAFAALDPLRAIARTIVAILLAYAVWKLLPDYARNTYALIKQTIEISEIVEVKYKDAIHAICEQHQEITLADLTSASKDWGFDWRPRLITETNRTPSCSGATP